MFEPHQENQEEKKKSAGIFGSKGNSTDDLMLLRNELNNLSRRVRIQEERDLNLRKKIQVIEQNMLSSQKKASTEIKILQDDLKTVKRELLDVKDKVKLLILELRESAKKEDVKVLERYINLWEPVNFVTQQEVVKMVQDIVEERASSKEAMERKTETKKKEPLAL
ncbi:hypothetical protein HYW21_02935 [Candidatus Woesearchaeota archaeon]|nr:hypothetical protein [Candidatus Woesearchaeota archaeon]